MDTIFALSSGRPPAAIAVVRITGPAAHGAARALTGSLPPSRTAAVRTLRDPQGGVLDRALVLAFDGPATATGEDLVELHLHGGRAVVAAVETALAAMPALRLAAGGEFTRRALENGRVDLAQAQGLADLLDAETEGARRAAIAASGGAIGRRVHGWASRVADMAARVEAALDYSDEGDVERAGDVDVVGDLVALIGEIDDILARPSVERLRDGPLIVLAGPPNAGKSSLFNALLQRDAAIVTDIAGTTRDVIEAAVIRGGNAYRLMDTAGLHVASADPVERIGIDRAGQAIDIGDMVLWFGDREGLPARGMQLHAKCDVRRDVPSPLSIAVSAFDGGSVEKLWKEIERRIGGKAFADDLRLHESQRVMVGLVRDDLSAAAIADDPLIVAEQLRRASHGLSEITGGDPSEAMLDALFSRFCVGK